VSRALDSDAVVSKQSRKSLQLVEFAVSAAYNQPAHTYVPLGVLTQGRHDEWVRPSTHVNSILSASSGMREDKHYGQV